MERSEAQKRADKKYRETHKSDSVTWGDETNARRGRRNQRCH